MIFMRLLLFIFLTFVTAIVNSEIQTYTKEEIDYLLALHPEDKKKFSTELDLISTNERTNDAVLILKHPVRLSHNADGALSGMPFVVKGTIPVAGLTPFNGLRNYPGAAYIYEKNLDIIDCILEAGATIVGQGKGPPFSARSISNPVGEPAIASRINSYYSSGGSSGGVAANNCFGLGTDIAGSGRIPAAYNKRFTLFGVHRSQQRVVYGLFYTPFADCADDLWKIYTVLEKKPTWGQISLDTPKQKRIVFVEKLPTSSKQSTVHLSRVKSLELAMDILKCKGHRVDKISPDDLKAFPYEQDESSLFTRNFVQCFAIDIAKNLNKLIENYGAPQRCQLDAMSWLLYDLGSLLLEKEEDIRNRAFEDFKLLRLHTKMLKTVKEIDIIITPTILAEWAKPNDFQISITTQTLIKQASNENDSNKLLKIAMELYQRELDLCNTLWGNAHDGDLPIVTVPGKRDEWGMFHNYQLIGLNGTNPEEIYQLLSLAKQLSNTINEEMVHEEN